MYEKIKEQCASRHFILLFGEDIAKSLNEPDYSKWHHRSRSRAVVEGGISKDRTFLTLKFKLPPMRFLYALCQRVL